MISRACGNPANCNLNSHSECNNVYCFSRALSLNIEISKDIVCMLITSTMVDVLKF